LKSGVNAKVKLKPEAESEPEENGNDTRSQKQKKCCQGRTVWTIKKKKKHSDSHKDKPVYKEFVRAHAQSRLVMQGQKYGRMDKNQGRLVPHLCVVSAACITGITIAVPNITHLSHTQKKHDLELGESMDGSFLFLNGRQHWPRIMGEWVRNPY
jgi:phage protein D